MYSEKQGVSPEPKDLRNTTTVGEIGVHEIELYRTLVENTPLLNKGPLSNSQLWCMCALLSLQQNGLINNVDLLAVKERASEGKP